uniref:Phosphotriesterase-related protein n=2 Tax=Hirondellea gigas TaxID=1518452 RepID=A0A2P2I146_9CRUS
MDTKGKVLTVLGPVEPCSLGRTLTHEHLSLDFRVAYTSPPALTEHKTECDFTLPNLGWIRQNPYSHHKNIQFNGEEVDKLVEEELHEFYKSGGGTIVENTSIGIKRNIALVKRLAKSTNVKLVAGTGYYVSGSQSSSTLNSTVEELCNTIVKDMTQGCDDDPTVRCGLLGEVGCSWPLEDFERRSVNAAGLMQQQLGCPVMFHPGRNEDAPDEILRLYAEAGGAMSKAVMGHLDRTFHTMEELEEFAALGSYLEYDLFGIETSHYQLNTAIDMPSDGQRIARIKHLVDAGYEDKILLSHDIHTRNRLSAFGGHGFSYILQCIVPKMLTRGLTQQDVDDFLLHNPQHWLTFTK